MLDYSKRHCSVWTQMGFAASTLFVLSAGMSLPVCSRDAARFATKGIRSWKEFVLRVTYHAVYLLLLVKFVKRQQILLYVSG